MAEIGIECTLFYVDDDQDDLQIFKEAADAIGEDVCVFEFADLMLHTLHNPPPAPSIVFIDLNMPTMDGYDVIKQIKMSPDLCHLPLIAYSTTANSTDINRCKMLGVAMFVTKPPTIQGIQKAIKHAVTIDWAQHQVTDSNFIYKG